MSVTRALADEIVETTLGDIQGDAIEAIKRATLDNLAIAYFSYDLVDKPFVEFAKAAGGTPQATLVGDGAKVEAGLAAGINAQMASDSDYEETGPGVHMFAPISAAAIAVGEHVGATGSQVVTATAMGYEINTRIFDALKSTTRVFSVYYGHPRRQLYLNTAVVAAKLMGLDATTVERAIGLAWVTATPPRMEVTFGMGNENMYRVSPHLYACQIGLQATRLAAECGGGLPDILDRTAGDEYRLEDLANASGRFTSLTDRMSLKPRVGSWGFQGGLELVADIVEEQQLTADDIERVVYRGPDIYVPFANPNPKTFWEAQGSIPLAIASLVLRIPSGKAWVDPPGLQEPARVALAQRVVVEAHEDPEVNEIELTASGSTTVRSIHRTKFHGSPHNPLTREDCETKFRTQAEPVIGHDRATAIIERVWSMEKLDDIRELTSQFGG